MWRVYAVVDFIGFVGVNVNVMRSLDHIMTPGTVGPVTSPSCKETYISMLDPIAWLKVMTIGVFGSTVVPPPGGLMETMAVTDALGPGPVAAPEQAIVPTRSALARTTVAVRRGIARISFG